MMALGEDVYETVRAAFMKDEIPEDKAVKMLVNGKYCREEHAIYFVSKIWSHFKRNGYYNKETGGY